MKKTMKKKGEQRDPVTVDRFGSDHWSTLAYVEVVVVDHRGVPDLRRMRCDADRHPGLWGHAYVVPDPRKKYPTRLRGGALLHDHDDHDCVDDLAAGGFVEVCGTGITPVYLLTDQGRAAAAALRAHKGAGGRFADFVLP